MPITAQDSRQLIRYGVFFAKDKSVSSCQEAAQLFVVSDDDEKMSVRMEFAEGVRNNVPSQFAYEEAMRIFDDWCEFYKLQA